MLKLQGILQCGTAVYLEHHEGFPFSIELIFLGFHRDEETWPQSATGIGQ